MVSGWSGGEVVSMSKSPLHAVLREVRRVQFLASSTLNKPAAFCWRWNGCRTQIVMFSPSLIEKCWILWNPAVTLWDGECSPCARRWLRSNSGPESWTMESNRSCSWCSMPRKALQLQIQLLDKSLLVRFIFSASCCRTTQQSFSACSSSTRGTSSWWGKICSPSFAFSPKREPHPC